MLVIGMMSGTSYDALDAAAAELRVDGDTILLEPRGMISEPYPGWLRAALDAAMPPSAVTMADVCRLDTWIGQAFASLAERAAAELCHGAADLVVSHGQTLYHWVHEGEVHGTLQLGQPAWIAERTGLPVVSDLRCRDVAAGGQGAPLVSIFDVLWLAGLPGTPVALNLGGIANITVSSSGAPVAFDTGPANALIDAAVRHLTGGRADIDVDGVMAARGAVHDGLLHRLLADGYYPLPAPKTTGKERFHLPYLLAALAAVDGPDLAADDVVATLTELTARTVADAGRRPGGGAGVAAGGGTNNPTLMRRLASALDGVPLRTSAELGIPAAAKEAYAFALLGYLSVHGLAGTVPSCTGAEHASVLGSVTPGREPLPPAVRGARPTRLRVHAAAGRS